MDIFAQKKLLIRLVIILGILNICTVGIVIWKEVFPPSKQPRASAVNNRDVSAILEKELGLTRNQAEQIRILRGDYNAQERELVAAIRIERDSMNAEMFNEQTSEELIHSLAKNIADNEYNMELLRFEQAKKLKSICTPEQVEKFNRLVREMRDFFKPDNEPEKKPDNKPGREQNNPPPKRNRQNN